MRRNFRKPLIVMTPKSLLRHKLRGLEPGRDGAGHATSTASLHEDTRLAEDRAGSQRVVLCAGKVYYDLLEEREQARASRTSILLRIEQLYPFPTKALTTELVALPQAEVVWCQEEPQEHGRLDLRAAGASHR